MAATSQWRSRWLLTERKPRPVDGGHFPAGAPVSNQYTSRTPPAWGGRLRFGRTKVATARSALRPLARQGHLVGTVTGPLPAGPSQGWSSPILTNAHEKARCLFNHLVGAGEHHRWNFQAQRPGG